MTTAQLVACPECYGTGKDPIRHNAWCFLCLGKGKVEQWVADGVKWAVSNAQADLADIVGVEEDLVP